MKTKILKIDKSVKAYFDKCWYAADKKYNTLWYADFKRLVEFAILVDGGKIEGNGNEYNIYHIPFGMSILVTDSDTLYSFFKNHK